MTCEELNGLLDKLMDGELTEDERAAMEAHGAECPECAAQIRATLQMKALFDEMGPEADVPLQAQANWRNAVRQEAQKSKKRKLTRWIGSAAAAVVVLVGVGLALNGNLAPKQPALLSAESAMEATPANGAEEAAQEVGRIETDGEGDADMLNKAGVAFEADDIDESGFAYEADSASEAVADGARAVAAEPMMDAELEEEMPQSPTMGENAEAETMCAAVAQQSPACELAIQAQNVEETCAVIGDLAEEFEGACDVQRVEGGSANVYVELYGENAADFLEAVVKLDVSDSAPQPPQAPNDASLLVLLVVNPAE